MRRTSTATLALAIFSLLACDSALANESREAVLKAQKLCEERLKSGNGYENVTAEDGTLVVCGQGEKAPWSETAGPEITAHLASGQFCKPGVQNLADALRQTGISAGYTAKTLIMTLSRTLSEMKKSGTYDYEITDALFGQLKDALLQIDWDGKDSGWYFNGSDVDVYDDLTELSGLGRSYGRRYGMRVVPLLTELHAEHQKQYQNHGGRLVDQRRLQQSLGWSIFNMLFLSNSDIPDAEKPTQSDKKWLAEAYLEWVKTYSEEWYGLDENATKILAEVAPHVLAEIEKLETKRREAANLKNVTEESEREWQKRRPETIEDETN